MRLKFMITLALKGVTKPWLAGCVLLTVVFVAYGLLLATCCPRDAAGRGQEDRDCYMHRASSEVLAVHQMF